MARSAGAGRRPGRLVAAYLRAFGPVTETDVAWWTGWPLGVTAAALAAARPRGRRPPLVHPDDTDPVDAGADGRAAPRPGPDADGLEAARLVPAGGQPALYDPYGNVGPTLWWGGEVVGGWAVRKDGTVATRMLVDRGAGRAAALERRRRLQPRMEGAAVTPSFPTPLEKELRIV